MQERERKEMQARERKWQSGWMGGSTNERTRKEKTAREELQLYEDWHKSMSPVTNLIQCIQPSLFLDFICFNSLFFVVFCPSDEDLYQSVSKEVNEVARVK